MLAAAAYLSSLPKSLPDTSFQTTPRPFDITATKNAFGQKEGQTYQQIQVNQQHQLQLLKVN